MIYTMIVIGLIGILLNKFMPDNPPTNVYHEPSDEPEAADDLTGYFELRGIKFK